MLFRSVYVYTHVLCVSVSHPSPSSPPPASPTGCRISAGQMLGLSSGAASAPVPAPQAQANRGSLVSRAWSGTLGGGKAGHRGQAGPGPQPDGSAGPSPPTGPSIRTRGSPTPPPLTCGGHGSSGLFLSPPHRQARNRVGAHRGENGLVSCVLPRGLHPQLQGRGSPGHGLDVGGSFPENVPTSQVPEACAGSEALLPGARTPGRTGRQGTSRSGPHCADHIPRCTLPGGKTLTPHFNRVHGFVSFVQKL